MGRFNHYKTRGIGIELHKVLFLLFTSAMCVAMLEFQNSLTIPKYPWGVPQSNVLGPTILNNFIYKLAIFMSEDECSIPLFTPQKMKWSIAAYCMTYTTFKVIFDIGSRLIHHSEWHWSLYCTIPMHLLIKPYFIDWTTNVGGMWSKFAVVLLIVRRNQDNTDRFNADTYMVMHFGRTNKGRT